MRTRWKRLVAVAVVVGATALASGCVVFQSGPSFSQLQTIGDVQASFTACASGIDELRGQGLLRLVRPARGRAGSRRPAAARRASRVPTSFTSTGRRRSPSPRARATNRELQRLAPARGGTALGGIHHADGLHLLGHLGAADLRGADSPSSSRRAPTAAPSRARSSETVVLGARSVSAAFPATRPVACGTALTTVNDEDPTISGIMSRSSARTPSAAEPAARRDLGVLAGNATASGAPGSLVEPAVHAALRGHRDRRRQLRPLGHEHPPRRHPRGHPRRPRARQQQRQPGPGGRRHPGRRQGGDLRRHPHRQARQRPDAQPHREAHGDRSRWRRRTTGGGTTAKLKLTTLLPKGLSAETARESGIAVLIGATKAGHGPRPALPGQRPEEPEAEGEQGRSPARCPDRSR